MRTSFVDSSELRLSLAEQRQQVEYQPVPTSPPAEQHHAAEPSKSWGARVLDSPSFQHCMGAVILANGVVIGLETDIKGFPYWDPIEGVFLTIFFVEVSFKMYVEGDLFFHPQETDFWWNIFDLFVVGIGMFDFIMSLVGLAGYGGAAISIFRMVRLMRVLRLLRLLKILKRLYLLAVGLVEACKAIIWVTVLMSTVLYVVSIVLVKTMGNPSATDPNYDFLKSHFGTIADSMISLFVLMSSPNLPMYQDEAGLLDAQPTFCLFLILFICFGSFGMIAMLTGVINESMFENNELKKEEKREGHETMRLSLGKRSADLYETLPLNESGSASVDDLHEIIHPAAELLDQSGVPIAHGDILKFLHLMDEDESGVITLADFVHGMEKISEGLSPLAIVEVQHHVGMCNKKLTQQLQDIAELDQSNRSIILHISEEVDRILSVISAGQNQRHAELAEKLERQMLHTSEQVDRILQNVTSDQSEHRSHLAEKIEAHMLKTSQEADLILQILEEQKEPRELYCSQSTAPAARGLDSCAAVSEQREELTAALQSAIDSKFSGLESWLAQKQSNNNSTMLDALDRQTEDLSTEMQSFIDQKFLELERQLERTGYSEQREPQSADRQMERLLAYEENSKRSRCDSTMLDALSKQTEDLFTAMQSTCDSTVLISLSKLTEDLSTSVQSAVDQRFSELERENSKKDTCDSTILAALSKQTDLLSAAMQSVIDQKFSELQRESTEKNTCDSTMLAALSKQTDDLSIVMQSVIDQKFSDLGRENSKRSTSDSMMLAALSKQIEDLSTAMQSVLDQKFSDIESENLKKNICDSTIFAALSKQTDDLSTAMQRVIDLDQRSSELERETSNKNICDSEMVAALSKQTKDLSTAVQSVIDQKFADLEREDRKANTYDSTMLATLSKQMDLLSAAVQSVIDQKNSELQSESTEKDTFDSTMFAVLSKQTEDLSAAVHSIIEQKVLKKNEEVIQSLKSEFGILMQESKSVAVRVGETQETINENIDLLTNKISVLEREADAAQTQLLNGVAELGGDIISAITELVSTGLVTIKQRSAGQKELDGKGAVLPS